MTTNHVPVRRAKQLSRLCDPLLSATLREERFKGELIAQAHVAPGHRVLDIGCGTGTLTLMIKARHPEASVMGLDSDPEVLQVANKNAVRRGLRIPWFGAEGCALPFTSGSFDRVLSSLFFHHLRREQKVETFARIFSMLTERGELHVADWGKPSGALGRALFLPVQVLEGFETTRDNVEGKLPELISEAGFIEVEETRRHPTAFGTLSLYRAVKPNEGNT